MSNSALPMVFLSNLNATFSGLISSVGEERNDVSVIDYLFHVFCVTCSKGLVPDRLRHLIFALPGPLTTH